ncbi:MAG: outer membrane protein OmpA-like peptidoglycan-associated protein [bacterium]
MDNKSTSGWLFATLVLTGLSLTACSTSPVRNVQLEQATRHYEAASRDVDIVRRASDQLDLARDALEMAESYRLKNANSQIPHYVYLFEQHMRMALLAVEQQRNLDKLEGRAETVQSVAMKDAAVIVDDDVVGEINWNLLLAAAHAATGERTPPDQTLDGSSDSGKKMTMGDVLFNVNKASLAAGSEEMIENLVLFLNRNSDQMAVIKGHTDNTGSKKQNLSLSRDRAFAVQEALVKAGISAQRLAVRGVGESDPVASNELESGRRLNRRVDVVLLE